MSQSEGWLAPPPVPPPAFGIFWYCRCYYNEDAKTFRWVIRILGWVLGFLSGLALQALLEKFMPGGKDWLEQLLWELPGASWIPTGVKDWLANNSWVPLCLIMFLIVAGSIEQLLAKSACTCPAGKEGFCIAFPHIISGGFDIPIPIPSSCPACCNPICP